MVFMWLLKRDIMIEKENNRIETFCENKERIINERLMRKYFKALNTVKTKNKSLKRVLSGIFQRNLELDFYVAFGKIRNEEHIYERSLIQADIDEHQGEIDRINGKIAEEEKKIEVLKDRLTYKEDTLYERKILGLYMFFVKNIKSRYGSYIKRWRGKVKRENRVIEFA